MNEIGDFQINVGTDYFSIVHKLNNEFSKHIPMLLKA